MASADTETTQAEATADTQQTTPAAPTETAPVAEESATQEPAATTVVVDTTPVAAQVPGPRPEAVGTVPVHETRVSTDHVILDTSSPLAVQVPPVTGDEGLTPIAKAYRDGKTPEDKLADEAKESEGE